MPAHSTVPRISQSLVALAILSQVGCGDDSSSDGGDTTESSGTDDPTTSSLTTTTATTTGTTAADDSSSSGTASTDATTETTGVSVTLLERVVVALGGQDSLAAMTAFEVTSTGNRYVSDEGTNPGGPPVPSGTYAATLTVDLAAAGVRIDLDRTLQFEAVQIPFTYSEIISGELGYVDGNDNLTGAPPGPMLSDRVASTVRQQRLLSPPWVIKDALAAPEIASEIGMEDFAGRPHELLQLEDSVRPLVLWVDSETDLVSRITTVEHHPLHRDIELDIAYDDWQTTDGGVAFPNQVVLTANGGVIAEDTRDSVSTSVVADPALFTLPMKGTHDADLAARGARTSTWLGEFVSLGLPLFGLQTFVEPIELAPGVWHLTGGSHHSMAIVQSGGVVLFETPLNEARCVAVLDWIDANLDGAPITHAVVSHSHVDHAACARTLVAGGATLVVGEGSEDLWTSVLAAPSTVEPDELSANPVADPSIELVPDGGSFTLDDADRPVTVYDLASEHAADMLLPYIEDQAIAYIADLYIPGLPFQLLGPTGSQEVLDSLELHGLLGEVSMIAGAHGFGTATVADVQAAAGG